MSALLSALVFGVFSPRAYAFCGTYVGQAGVDLYNGASQIAITRQGSRTTLTLVNDYQGDLSDFALVVPVPEILGPDDVRVVDPAAVAAVEGYSAPRLVSYTCDDFMWDDSTSDTASPEEDGGGETADGSVRVEAEFTAGEYNIVVLSAQESTALITWLTDNGYGVDASAEDLLGEYIDSGSYFFAARVALDALPEGASYLSPLQFGYEADNFSLPIRLGTLNSAGEQDLLLYVLSDAGQTAISNYTQLEVENECMYREEDWADFGTFYNDRFGEAVSFQARAGWIMEYGWSASNCDPCATEPLSDEQVQALGWSGGSGDAYFTRLHMRYTPEQIDQDLVLYGSNIWDTFQVRYILYNAELEDLFPSCITGWAENPGTCQDDTNTGDDTGEDISLDDEPLTSKEPRWSCGTPLAPGLGAAGLALALVSRRRRSPRA